MSLIKLMYILYTVHRSLETRAPWIHLVPMPNLYRGLVRHYDGTPEEIALKYAGKYISYINCVLIELY